PHHLDQDRELQLATADDLHLFRRVRRLDANGDVADELLVEPILDLARRHELSVPAGERRRVDAEAHGDGRLVDGNRGDGLRALGGGDRLADHDALDAREADDRPGRSRRRINSLQPLERVELGHDGALHGPVKFADANRVADLDAAVEDAADGQAAQVVARVEIGDERLQRRVGRPARRRDVVDHRIEQWTQVRTRLLQRQGGRALSRVRVEDGEVELVFRGVEIDEEVVDLV